MLNSWGTRIQPATWWLVGFAFAISAAAQHSLVVLGAIALVSVGLIYVFRQPAPWAQSLRFYLWLAAVIVIVRIGFRIVFSYAGAGELSPDQIALNLPPLDFELGALGSLHLLGPLTWATLNAALVDGLRLAAIILSVGMANTLANPRKLLKSTPGALYEVATAISVAINLAPQLIDSLHRVRRARLLRGRSQRVSAFAGTVIPVLEETIDRSLNLAASMDARGFGRRGSQTKLQRGLARGASVVSIVLELVGSYLLLATVGMTAIAIALIAVGLALTIVALRLSSLGSVRTRFKPQVFGVADFALVGIALLVLLASLLGWWPL